MPKSIVQSSNAVLALSSQSTIRFERLEFTEMEFVNEIIESQLTHDHCLQLIEKSSFTSKDPSPPMSFKDACQLLYDGISATKIDFENPKKHMFVTLKLRKNHQEMTYK